MIKIASISTLLRALSDPVRLRILQLLTLSELSVGELVRIIGMPQSSISRHLRALKDEGLVSSRPEGSATFYCAHVEGDTGTGETELRDVLARLLRDTELPTTYQLALEKVLASRGHSTDQFFNRIGLRWDALREECFGSSFHLESFLGLLPEEWVIADLGTGTGYLLPVLGRFFRKVIAVDSSAAMLELAGKRAQQAGVDAHVQLCEGDLEKLPIPTNKVDLAVALLMLHHLPDIPAALHEISRILKPGGKLLLVEIHRHQNEAFRLRMADRRAGVTPLQLRGWLGEASLRVTRTWDLPPSDKPDHELAPLPRLYAMVAEAIN